MPSNWNPWRGCRKCSTGCLHCYIHKGDAKRGVETSIIKKTEQFYRPIERNKKGEYKMKSGLVWLCFSSDFLIEDADEWRKEVWDMIRERQDCSFLFLTKRIARFLYCIPPDWGDGYDNVYVCCTVENQKTADERLSLFSSLPIKHKGITAQPLVEKIDIENSSYSIKFYKNETNRNISFSANLSKEECEKQDKNRIKMPENERLKARLHFMNLTKALQRQYGGEK